MVGCGLAAGTVCAALSDGSGHREAETRPADFGSAHLLHKLPCPALPYVTQPKPHRRGREGVAAWARRAQHSRRGRSAAGPPASCGWREKRQGGEVRSDAMHW